MGKSHTGRKENASIIIPSEFVEHLMRHVAADAQKNGYDIRGLGSMADGNAAQVTLAWYGKKDQIERRMSIKVTGNPSDPVLKVKWMALKNEANEVRYCEGAQSMGIRSLSEGIKLAYASANRITDNDLIETAKKITLRRAYTEEGQYVIPLSKK